MTKKRDHMEVIHDILVVLRDKRGEVKPTHILYKSNLSSQMLKDYLEELLQKGMISETKTEKGRYRYGITDKGYSFLRDYRMIRAFTESYGLD